MNGRSALTALAIAGVAAAGFGAAVLPASAEPRTITVTLLGGQTIVVQVDVPPGTPLDQIRIPGVNTPIIGISETPPAGSPAPPAGTPTPAPAPEPAPQQQGDPGAPRADKTRNPQTQQTTRKPRRTGDPAVPSDGEVGALGGLAGDAGKKAKRDKPRPGRGSGGVPTTQNPTFALALPGAAPIGVPNFFIEKFRIPPFLLPIYQAAGIQYGIRWEVLAAINEIETDYGRNLNVSSAGAVGWMQFLPSTWKVYGVDANKDGRKDPYNPVDAIFAAARYLRAAGAETDLRKAIFAYNHADWYVDSVVMRARLIGGLPSNLVGSLTGLTQAHFPVHAKARYADDIDEAEALKRVKRGGNPAYLVDAKEGRRGINVYARRGAPVIAVNDGRVLRVGRTKRLGRFVQIQDVYGNTFTYGHLKKVARTYAAARTKKVTPAQIRRELSLPAQDAAPKAPATAGARGTAASVAKPAAEVVRVRDTVAAVASVFSAALERTAGMDALFERQLAGPQPAKRKTLDPLAPGTKGYASFNPLGKVFRLKRKDVVMKRLRPGARIAAGTILGRIGKTTDRVAPHVLFEIRPAGRGAPRIDPKPILDGWKLLESTAIYRAAGRNPFVGPDAKTPSIGQILLMSKEALAQRVLANPRVEVYECGRRDIRSGVTDRRVLATLEFLAASGLKPTVTSLRCGHGFYTKSGNVSHHSSGNAVDIARINGIPILGHQGPGSITEMAVQRLLTLQGTMRPDQIITLMEFEGADNTYAMGDHADHIHIGWRPMYGTNSKMAKQVNAVLKPEQWIKLIDRLSEIDNPEVRSAPSKYAIKTTKRASRAHAGE